MLFSFQNIISVVPEAEINANQLVSIIGIAYDRDELV